VLGILGIVLAIPDEDIPFASRVLFDVYFSIVFGVFSVVYFVFLRKPSIILELTPLSDPRVIETRCWGESPKELIVQFGVIKVLCKRGEAKNCRVEVKARLTEMLGTKISSKDWIELGFLNWFSVSKKTDLQVAFSRTSIDLGFGINEYLKNTIENIAMGDNRDLLLFYMIKGMNTLFVCADNRLSLIGHPVGDMPLRFEIELAVTADGYSKTISKYQGCVKWGDFQITPI
jgi:hypothetical protein